MSLLFDSVLSEAIAVAVVLSGLVFWYFHHAFQYWESRGIPSSPATFPMGHIGPVTLRKEAFGHRIERIYNEFANTSKYTGLYSFSTPSLIINDPEQIKNIFVRDFSSFHDRGVYFNERDDPLSAHLFAIEGKKWRNLRTKLSPTFTSGKLKFMYPTILERADSLNEYLQDAVTKTNSIEIKDVLARFTTDVIGTCAFGIECNSLKDPDSEFRKVGQSIFVRPLRDIWKLVFMISYKDLGKTLGVKLIKPEVHNFFMRIVKDTIIYREKNNVRRNDFMDMLIQLKNKGRLEDDTTVIKEESEMSGITINEIAAQSFVFFIAGFETSSSVMSFCLYELTVNPEIQERTRNEIKKVIEKHDGKMTYEAMLEMPYLDRVINETLRKYPTLPILQRKCTKDYKLPGTDTVLTKGTQVIIPVRGLHHDPKYYPNPEKFDPDRFTEENKAKRHHFTYLPFGEGPRVCIGMRFGMMQTRLGLVTVLMNYKLERTEKTLVPLILDPKSFLTASKGGIWLKLTPLTS